MDSSIKINSISIDLAGATNEINMVKCDHFSIRGYAAETRERDHRRCWPFSEGNHESYPLPSLSVPKFRWWRCLSCIKDINADVTKGHANLTSISGEKLDGISSVIIPSITNLNTLTITNQEEERENDSAGNAVVENEDVNCERSQKDDQTVAATTLVKKVHPPSMDDASTVRRKMRKLTSGQQVGNKRSKVSKSSTGTSSWKEKQQNVTTFASTEIAGVVDDTPPKAIKNHKDDKVSSESLNLGFQRRKTRKVRLLSELIVDPETKASGGSNNNVRQEESSSSKGRGRKRKVPPENNYVSRKLSTAGATSDQGDSDSTDSGFDIRGKKKNRRFQVVDEFVPSQEGSHENHAGPSKNALSTHVPRRTENKFKKKKTKPVIMDKEKSSLISFSSGPSINASSKSTQDPLNAKRVGSSLDERLAAEGYFRKPIPPQVNDRPVTSLHVPENVHVRPRGAEANCLQECGSSSKSNTGGWLRTVVDAVDFSLNNNNNNTDKGLADLSSVLQKDDASGSDRKGKRVMVQEHQGAQSHDRKENTPEEQNDDITLEIAELMAKNQYERCLPDKEEDVSNKQPPQEETAHRSKNALLIDLNETYDNHETSLEDNNNNNNTSKPQQKPLDFFPLRQPYVTPSSPFGIFPPTQENRSNSIRFSSSHNWLGNVPAMANQHPSSSSSYRVLRGCNTCYQSVPHQYREPPSSHVSHPSWPPPSMVRPHCHPPTPVSFNMDHQSTRLGSSNNNNTWNLNFVAAPNGKQRCDGTRSVDAYSNESSIPALNLLSLMDPRLRSNAPAEHQGNTNFTRRHFPPSKERVGIETGNSSKTSAYTTKQSPFNFYSNGFAPEASRKSFPIGPPLGTSSFSFQNAQTPWGSHHHQHHHQQEKINKVFPSSNDQGRFQLLRGSNSMKLPLKTHVTEKEMNQKRKAEGSSNVSALPQKNSSGSFVCSVNKNPADFTIPEPGNVYMITSENLKVRKRAPYKTKASLCKEDAMKQTKKTVGPVTENA
ncbi:unnamed protein product [Eruca vesicaria subsp. sativa]|uniref:Embryonic flower 1 n=1 Tax=Eruca vesicaria subsp. sativa TaxID=29727 RepID=A0ABC8M7G0_ERUVS|nr:unnamed protein product [Eruca vesicaria subsp. sativa]